MRLRSLFAILALTCLNWNSAPAQEAPELKDARVTIPYGELKELLESLHNLKEESAGSRPPLEAALSSASYTLDFSSGDPILTADFEARTFSDSWHSIPLFGGTPKLEAANTDDNTSVVFHENSYKLITRGEGTASAQLTLSVPPARDWERGNNLRFTPAAAARNLLTVTGLPAGKVIRIDDLAPVRSSGNQLTFRLPDGGKDLKLYLEEGSADSDMDAILPSTWSMDSQVLARYSDGRIKYAARIQVQAASGSGLSLSIALPINVSRVSVEGDDLADWTLAPRAEGHRILEVNWETRDVLDRELLVNWESPQSPLSDTWNLTPPHPLPPAGSATEEEASPVETRTLIALVQVDGLELSHPSLQTSVESRRLPEWLQKQLGTDDSLTIELENAKPVPLSANWLPRMETAQATISLAKFDTQLVEDGSLLITADYTIQHDAPLTWKLTLPSSDQILTCEVNRKAFSPIQRPEDVIEFRLPSPEKIRRGKEPDDGEFNGSRIRLSYALKTDKLDPVSGRVALELPETDLFIHQLDWDLMIPDRYEPSAVEGNVQLSFDKSSSSNSETSLIRLQKKLCRGERPSVEVHYQSKDLDARN